MKLLKRLALLPIFVIILGCNHQPPVQMNNSKSHSQPTGNTADKDLYYMNLLEALEQRNAVAEAKQAIASNQYQLMGYYSGRAGLKVPGIDSSQQPNARCQLNVIDGMGDVIYGENHMKYRIAMRKFATAFNTEMRAVCF